VKERLDTIGEFHVETPMTPALVAKAYAWATEQFPDARQEIEMWPTKELVDFYVYA
jgi:hypothetical protein